jgi:hypothetical protein
MGSIAAISDFKKTCVFDAYATKLRAALSPILPSPAAVLVDYARPPMDQELLPGIRVTLIEPGVVATELPGHITHAATRDGVQQLYDKAEVTAGDIAEVIAFVLARPRRLAINEILLRPAGQP